MFHYIGVDVGKFSHAVCVIDQSGKENLFQIDNNVAGFENLKKKLLPMISLENILVGMEATGHYFLNLYEFLLKIGLKSEQIALLNPLQVKAFRNTNLRGAKSDNVDARQIAVLLRFGNFNRCNVAVNSLMNLRELTRLRADLVADCGDLKRKIISVLDRIFPEFGQIFNNQFGVTAIALLTDYPTPEELAAISLEKLIATVKGLSKRPVSSAKISKLHAAAKNSAGISFGKEAFKIELNILLEQMKTLEKQTDNLEQEITKMIDALGSPIFSIPGIGHTTGAAIIAEIGNIENFSSAVKLIAFAGLDPKLKESGNYQGKTPISKRGSKYLRGAIWYSAMVACRCQPKFKQIYQERRDKGKSHRYAVTAAANKLTKIIYHILKNNEQFNPDLA